MPQRTRGRPAHPDVLTPTEWVVLDAWRHGMSMSYIATRRGISRYGVRFHLRNAAQKLNVDTDELRHFPGFPTTSARSATHRGDLMTTDSKLELGPLGQVSMLTRGAADAEAWYRDALGLSHIF